MCSTVYYVAVFVSGIIGAGVVLVVFILGASLITLLIYFVHVQQVRSCNEHKDAGAYEAVEIGNVPVRCPMNDNQAYEVPKMVMLEEKNPKLNSQDNTEIANAIGSKFLIDQNEAYATVTENVYDTIKD